MAVIKNTNTNLTVTYIMYPDVLARLPYGFAVVRIAQMTDSLVNDNWKVMKIRSANKTEVMLQNLSVGTKGNHFNPSAYIVRYTHPFIHLLCVHQIHTRLSTYWI